MLEFGHDLIQEISYAFHSKDPLLIASALISIELLLAGTFSSGSIWGTPQRPC